MMSIDPGENINVDRKITNFQIIRVQNAPKGVACQHEPKQNYTQS